MNRKALSVLLSIVFFLLLFSCTKVNEATQLGDDLIPAVDNVNTFDTTISLDAAYRPFDDTSKHYINDNMALGKINDPLFGTATADMYFNLSSSVYGTHPYSNRDSAIVDSVVLSLAYSAGYGDTTSTAKLAVQVYEIAAGNGFIDDSVYRYSQPAFSTKTTILGSRTFSLAELKDSVQIKTTGRINDSSKVANVLRIRLSNAIGNTLKSFDTTSSANGGYKSDSVFRTLFRGLAVKTVGITSAMGTFGYFTLTDVTNTALTVYYRNSISGVKDTAAATYVHNRYGQANSIVRNAAGEYLANINKPASQNFYLQSSPSGSYISIKIPGFENFPNRVIHRAELVANQVSDPYSNYFTVPNLLFLDHKGPYGGTAIDTAYFFEKDILTTTTGTFDYATFGGKIKSDNSYHFNITRYIQGLVTRKERNDSLRLYAPVRAGVYELTTKSLLAYPYTNILDNVAKGRVVLAGSRFADSTKRLRIRIIYSNL